MPPSFVVPPSPVLEPPSPVDPPSPLDDELAAFESFELLQAFTAAASETIPPSTSPILECMMSA
jgi:hypothetical protein